MISVLRAPLACALAVVALAACGRASSSSTPSVPTKLTAPSAATAPTTLGPDTLPPPAIMPPAGVAASKELVREGDDEGARCAPPSTGSASARGQLDAIIRDCKLGAGATRAGDAFGGQQGEGDAAERRSLPVAAGRCYRIVAAHDTSVEQLGVVVLDGRGAVAFDGEAPVAPASGWLCAKASGAVTIAVSVGRGRGRWMAEVWIRS